MCTSLIYDKTIDLAYELDLGGSIDCLHLKGHCITLVGSADRLLGFLIIMSVKSGFYKSG